MKKVQVLAGESGALYEPSIGVVVNVYRATEPSIVILLNHGRSEEATVPQFDNSQDAHQPQPEFTNRRS